MKIDFSSSVGIYPVLYIILQSFVIAFTLRSTRAFNISVDFHLTRLLYHFSLKIWPSVLLLAICCIQSSLQI